MSGPIALYLVFLFVFQANSAVQVTIYKFKNNVPSEGFQKICDSIPECLRREFAPYHIKVRLNDSVADAGADKTPASSDEETMIFGRMDSLKDKIMITGFFKMDLEQTLFKKEVEYSAAEPAAENARALALKILYAYEKKFLAHLQIFTEPQGACISLNHDSMGLSPWESLYPKGVYPLQIKSAGYLTVQKDITVGAGDNKFTFILSPEIKQEEQTPRPVPVIQAAAVEKPAKSRVQLFLAASCVMVAAGSHLLLEYYGTSDYYMKKTDDQQYIDRQYRKRVLCLYLRNSSIAFSAFFTVNYFFPVKRIFSRDKTSR